jgi:hypothetical protein
VNTVDYTDIDLKTMGFDGAETSTDYGFCPPSTACLLCASGKSSQCSHVRRLAPLGPRSMYFVLKRSITGSLYVNGTASDGYLMGFAMDNSAGDQVCSSYGLDGYYEYGAMTASDCFRLQGSASPYNDVTCCDTAYCNAPPVVDGASWLTCYIGYSNATTSALGTTSLDNTAGQFRCASFEGQDSQSASYGIITTAVCGYYVGSNYSFSCCDSDLCNNPESLSR